MAMSEKFKALGVDQQRLLVGKVKKLYDAGITAEMISEGLNKKTSPITENQTTINSIPHDETKKVVSLAAISSKIQACTRCRLAATRTNTVPGTGVEKPLVLVIGEGPGYEEDQQALPFVGAAGELLDKMLASICLSRNHNCYIALNNQEDYQLHSILQDMLFHHS